MEWLQTGVIPLEVKLTAGVIGALATGFIGGMVGLALGRPRLLLVYWAAESPAFAAGTNILISSLSALSGAWKHYKEDRVDLGIVAFMGIPTFVGAFIGGFFGGRFPGGYLMLFVAATTTWFGYNYLIGRKRKKKMRIKSAAPRMKMPPFLSTCGSRKWRLVLLSAFLAASLGWYWDNYGYQP